MKRAEIAHFLMPQKCPVCREPLPPDAAGAFLCPICRAAIEFEKQKICKVCGNRASECLCKPEMLKTDDGDMLKLMFYEADTGQPADRLVMYMKHYKDKRVFGHVADMLLTRLCKSEERIRENPENYVFTFVPRSKKATALYGFDQSKILAREMAKQSGATFAVTSKRTLLGKSQKKLDYKKRAKNAKKSFLPLKNVDLTGKTVILIDDVATSGASMKICAKYIKTYGAERIVFLSVCSVEPKLKKD